MKEATKAEHCYYHLLSGVDLPLKSQEEIHEFFKMFNGLEFIDEDSEFIEECFLDRIKYYHFLTDKKGTFAYSIKEKVLRIQKLFEVNRIKRYSNICFQKGRNWFSITHELAREIIKNELWIKTIFKYSHCGDELFLQSFVKNSIFVEKICNKNTMPEIPDTRYIDWERGNPYVFRKKDYLELKNTSALFARKFDENIDYDIVKKIYTDLS